MADALLTVEGLTKAYGDKILFENISFGINAGQKTALIARNGYGKSSLLNILTGKVLQDAGSYTFRNDIKMAYLPQDPDIHTDQTVKDFVFASENTFVRLVRRYEEALLNIQIHPSPEAESELQECINTMDALNAWDYENKVKEILYRLKINDLDKSIKIMSGGEQKKVALARTLIDDCNFLILDEPTNHMDIKSKDILKQALKSFDGTLILVSHDRDFLDGLVDKMYEFRDGQVHEFLGSVSEFLERRKLESLHELERVNLQKNNNKAPKETLIPDKNKSKEDRKRKERVKYLEAQISQKEAEMKEIEKVLSSPSPDDDIMEMTRTYLELKRDVDSLTDEWGSLI